VSALRLDSDRIRELIGDRYGGSISRLAAALPLDEPPDRSTVTRWLSSDGRHFPRDEERILALAGALDVDPTALWTFDAENFPMLWPKIVRAARTGRWSGLLKALAFFRYFADQSDDWPPQAMARRFFNREWVVNEFAHDPHDGKNYYQDLVVRPRRPQGIFPTVWHLAFRHGGVRAAKWQPFGFVRRDAHRVALFNDWAITDEAPTTPADQDLCIRTWFGQGAATFRIASLHPFTLSIPKGEQAGLPTVHFGFPGEVIERQA
jgi:hypothetical protein